MVYLEFPRGVLPGLEHSPMFNAINFDFAPEITDGVSHPMNATVNLTVVAMFLCPSDARAGQQNSCSYQGSYGTTTNDNYPQTGGCTGLFTVQQSFGIPTCTDGTSGTVAFAERWSATAWATGGSATISPIPAGTGATSSCPRP